MYCGTAANSAYPIWKVSCSILQYLEYCGANDPGISEIFWSNSDQETQGTTAPLVI